jgi:ADP-heptose:LPS heptosyltransferase
MNPGLAPYEVRLPRDRQTADRLRARARAAALLARACLLHAAGCLRRRQRRPPPPSRVARLLAVRVDRLGDMVLTTPALADLRRHFREAEITVLAPAAPLELLAGHPAVDRRVALTAAGLPPHLVGRFDLAIDFSSDDGLRGAMLAGRTRARWRIGLGGGGRQVFFNLKGPRAGRARHVVDLHADLVRALGAEPSGARPALYPSAEERGAAAARLAALGAAAPRAIIHPGGHYPTQRWAPEMFAEVITRLTARTGSACIVIAGPGEEDLVERIRAVTPDALWAGPLGVREMMALVASCELFVGGNSGPLHVAGALGVPTVSVMGPTDPRRFAPRGPADRVVRRDLPCSPCARGRCWHHTCLRAVEPAEVVVLAEAILEEIRPREKAR